MYKTIIVDDEQYSYEYLEECINDMSEDFEVVGTFRNGAEAWRFINEERVDVVITDIKMPVMSGLELIKLIYENNLDISVIIISGYEDFEYARQAIKYNVFYYLLKAIDLDDFFDVLSRLKQQLDKKYDNQSAAGETDCELERFFARGLTGSFESIAEMKTDYARLGLKIDFEEVICCIYEIQIEQYDVLLSEKWKYGKDSFEKAIAHVIESIFEEEDETVFIFSIMNSVIQCMVLKDSDKDCSDYVTNNIKKLLDIGVSVNCKGTPVRIKEMRNLCEMVNDDILKKMRVSYPENVSGCEFKNADALFEDDEDEIGAYSGNDVEKAIAAAKEYMDRNYSKDISRYDIAECTYFAPKYFGKIFKRKTGKTIADYLMEIRMTKAIELLDTDMKIQDIAVAVGMTNMRTFQRMFKNFTGYSAAEYRRVVIKNRGFK